MKVSKWLVALACLVALAAIITSGVGLFSNEGAGPVPFTTLHGDEVELYGRGLYRFDTAFKAPINRGTDAVTLFVSVPLLLAGVALYRRGSLRGGVLLTSMLVVFLYVFASLGFGVAYNDLFLLYIVGFSASLFGVLHAFACIDLAALAERLAPGLPRRGMAIFMFVAGLSVFVWLIEIIGGLAAGSTPASVASYTTDATALLDMGIIAPAVYLTGFLLLRRSPLANLTAPILLTLNAIVGLTVISQTVAQRLAGIVLAPGQIIVYVGIFVLLGGFAIGLLVRYYRALGDQPAARQPMLKPARARKG